MYNMQEPYFAASAILPCGDAEKRVGTGATGEPKSEVPDLVI